MITIGILNGPNLGRLGKRNPEIYGTQTLKDLEADLEKEAAILKVAIDCFQSNSEGALIDKLEAWADQGVAAIVFNPGAYTHTSIALHDAVESCKLPTVEVHLSNIYQREAFRQKSMTAPACQGIIAGLGFEGYSAALRHLVNYIHSA